VIESRTDPDLRRIHNNAGMVTPDGMPLVWLSWLNRKRHVERVYGPDLMLEVCCYGQSRKWRHFFYGTTEETLERLSAKLLRVCPEMEIAGCMAPPFRNLTPDEFECITSKINNAAADIVWVGLSTPKQERWMHAARPHLDAAVLLGVGAAFDFHAGKVRQAPRWIQRCGMEWAYRLYTEPRRLWRRYLRNNPAFVALILTQLAGLRRFPAD
jgi:N-acetylglucosaminyldiphosphoundecaprenol N-acetyl-beta-D-mannosaminyltransferase